MSKYQVCITETITYFPVEVKADDEDCAKEIVLEMLDNNKIKVSEISGNFEIEIDETEGT